MDKKKLLLLVAALLVAVGTAFAARSLFMGASTPQVEAKVEPKGPKVLVAMRSLPTGTIITADSINFQEWPVELVKDAYFIDGEADMTKLLGTVVRFPVTAGQPVTQGALVAPGDRGFLAAALGPGMRAVTIPVSAKTGVAGFVFPGDRVDLVLTQSVSGDSGQPLKAAETILRNLRVLATDQSTESETVDGKTVVRAFRTVTLEVTPRIAEKVAVAQTIGSLSLSLRSLADDQAQLERAIASGEVNVPAGATKQQEEGILRQAMNRPVDSATSFVTGGDVSRFQRKSRPATTEENAAKAAQMMTQVVQAAAAASGVPAQAAGGGAAMMRMPTGPVVRVTRGKNTIDVAVEKGQ
jgi:pilus assembly protein CpaB